MSNEIYITKTYITDKEPNTWQGTIDYEDKKNIAVKTTWIDDYDLGLFKIYADDEGTEAYFTDRMYNILIIFHGGKIAGYYVNMAGLPHRCDDRLEFTDYAIDICISPDGRYKITDLDEYDAYKYRIDAAERRKMLSELREIKRSLDKKGIEYISQMLYFI